MLFLLIYILHESPINNNVIKQQTSSTPHAQNAIQSAFRAFCLILHQQSASSARKEEEEEEEEEAPAAKKERGVALRLPDLQSGVSSLAEHLIPSFLVTLFPSLHTRKQALESKPWMNDW
jgi:hypothetical protein